MYLCIHIYLEACAAFLMHICMYMDVYMYMYMYMYVLTYLYIYTYLYVRVLYMHFVVDDIHVHMCVFYKFT